MSNRENLKEIIDLVDKALVATQERVIDTEVEPITKTGFISIGGVLDSIKLLAEDSITRIDEKRDNIDRPNRHSIAGHMNDPSVMQIEAFKKTETEDTPL